MDTKRTAIQLNPEQLRKLQLEMLNLLIEFDRICRKHKIRYFLSCGTLIGAIRHQGFIPWDDDVDVEMLRGDYERFCEVCENEIDAEQFFFQNYKNDSNYNWVYGKMWLKGTEFIRVGQRHLKQKTGICIDIFIMDNVPTNPFMQKFMDIGAECCRKLSWSSVGALRAKSKEERFVFKCLSLLPKSLIVNFYEWLVHLYSNHDTEVLAFFNTKLQTRRGYTGFGAFKRDWYKESLDWDFEGYKFSVPNGYHEILYLKYGEYMKLPSVENRHGNADAEYIKFSDGTMLGKKDA